MKLKPTQYTQIERKIAAAETTSIRERWLYGLRLLRDPAAMSEGGGGLKHGVAETLTASAAKRGIKLSAREIQRRVQCARAYPTEAQIRQALADFDTWWDLSLARFPAYEAPPEEPEADHRTEEEKRSDRARAAAAAASDGASGQQLSLFAGFEPTQATVKDLVDYATEQAALTERFAERDRKRAAYVAELVAACPDEDLSTVWADAHFAAYGEDLLDGDDQAAE